jgi:hypothetical protein
MSTQYYATTVVGIRLSRSAFYEDIEVRGCEHVQTTRPFCAECGASTLEGRSREIEGFNEDDPSYRGIDIIGTYSRSDAVILGIAVGKVCNEDGEAHWIQENGPPARAMRQLRIALQGSPFEKDEIKTYTMFRTS